MVSQQISTKLYWCNKEVAVKSVSGMKRNLRKGFVSITTTFQEKLGGFSVRIVINTAWADIVTLICCIVLLIMCLVELVSLFL